MALDWSCAIFSASVSPTLDGLETHRPMNPQSIPSLLAALLLVSCAMDLGSDLPSEEIPPNRPVLKTTKPTAEFTVAKEPLDSKTAASRTSQFPEGPGRLMTIAQCTGCHSGALVRQYRSTRLGWQNLIRWMQKKQGLWALDPSIENEILDYLSTHYGRSADAEDRRRPELAAHLMPPSELNK